MSDLAHIATSIVAFFAAFLLSSAPPPPPPLVFAEKPAQVAVLFGGDMMFDRSIRVASEKNGGDFILSCLDPLLEGQDLVVANLEGPITTHASKSVGSLIGSPNNFIFTFPLSTAALLFSHNIHLVNLGNNHIENFGREGVRSTMKALADAGVGYFGDPIDYTVERKDIEGVSFSFINYNEFGGDATTTIGQIKEARVQDTLPIVYTHWGVEYATTSPAYIQELAHAFVDAGAEIVIGSHPHVVEEREFYKEKYIYYSLGNLIFDQYWDEKVRRGLMVRVVFDGEGVQYVEEIPVELGRDRRTCVVE